MSNDNPILNNPYEEPKYHYNVDMDGNLDYSKILEGRRPYIGNIQITPNRISQSQLFSAEDLENSDADAKFINGIRQEVKFWREKGYPMVTRITRELLNFWFNNPERQNFQKLFFCQREAIETAIYLNEVAERDPNIGRNILRQLDERRESVSDLWEYVLPRTAFKMATGTGKTVVMAMLILYHYLNKAGYHNDTRFADHFLLVAPGITIRDRLGVLMLDESAVSRYDKKDYYHQRGLIPEQYEKMLGGLNNAITITNYHQFEPKVYTGKKASPLDGKMVYRSGEGMVKQTDKEDFQSVLSRILGPGMKGKRFIVINDEAHHCYLPKEKDTKSRKKDEETAEGEEENKKAMVWYEGLRQMKALGYKLQHVYDLSATPYYLKGSGYAEYSLFPWVVSDFGLVEAIESGLVKIPFLPSMDDTHDLEEPKLRNIYEHIRGDLPKKGQKAAKKKAREEAAAKGTSLPIGEAQPVLPTLLTVALEQFVKDYEKYDRGMREAGEAAKNLMTTPPVFIVVCNNTTVSKEVFKYIAGYETVDADGNNIYVDGVFPIFSNYANGMPKNILPSLLIDSSALDEVGNTIDEEFKRVFRQEINDFKRDYALMHGAGSADQLTDGDILREVVNTVGKQGKLGGHIRCVVSVSMLTEGWDANTVTHVCGVRAFGSQLLCEQVAGRALRRRSYELAAYDRRTGEEIPSEKLYRYNKENVVYKFQPEYAHIIGVPFKTFKGGTAAPPKPPKPTTIIRSLKEREDMEIVFPNIAGYRSERENSVIEADFSGLPKFKLDFNRIPMTTTLRTPIGNEEEILKTDYKNLRDAQVVYELTRRLLSAKYRDESAMPMFQKFAQLKAVVQKWYDAQVEIIGGDGDADARRLVLFWSQDATNASISEGIEEHNRESERIIAILNHYNPEGSTKHVFGATTKNVWATEKSHINYVVADTDSWEQIAAKTLEEIRAVKKYVKNHFLDFKIPYMALTEEKNYVPDFIAVVETPSGETVNLIIEISGFSNDKTNFKEEKRHYMKDYWLPAANNLKKYGRWDFIEITDIDNIKPQLIAKINSL